LTARLELRQLRGGPPWIDWDRLADWAATMSDPAPAWIDWLRGALLPLVADGRAPLATHVARHRAAAEALAAGPQDAPAHGLWDRAAGSAVLALMQEMATEADACPEIDPAGYRALVQSLMAARDVPEEAVVAHPDLAIWGTLEARVQSAELVLLGGLNEGTWPRLPGADPWLSRAMRRELGLPSPERQVGLSAHDFQQAMGAPRVIVSRGVRDAEAPTVASRWLLRLENLLIGLGDEGVAALAAAKARGRRLLDLAAHVDRPPAPVPPARRPSPRPPAEARPQELSVTQIEKLVRDPYEIYARKVLRLKPLDPPGRFADPLTRGKAIHAGLYDFLAATAAGLPPDAVDVLMRTVGDAFAEAAPWPAVRALWTARLERAAEWFVAGEVERRVRGRPVRREVSGRRELDGLARPFAVTARADRIDALAGGGYAIYDYKSGKPPSAAEARAFHLQLPLEGAIAAAGGFEELPAGPARHLELIGVFGCETRLVDAAEIAATWARLRALIAFYQDPASGFTARLRPQSLKYDSDFDHLSRKDEWADGDPPEGSA
jgi:RecB family exonuclease